MSPAPDDIARVARAMLREYDHLLDLVVERVWSTVPGYSEYVLERADLRNRIGESVSIVVTCLLEGREPSAGELSRAARNGERRALQGISPTAVLQSYRTAERILGDEFQGWCSRMQVRPGSARAGRAALIAHLDALERAMLDAYSEIHAQVEADHRLSEPTLFRRIASGEPIEPAEIERLAIAVGLDDPDRAQFVAVAAAGRTPADRTAVEQYRHRLAAALGVATRSQVLSGTVDRAAGAVVLLAVPWAGAPEALVRDVDQSLARVGGDLRAALGDSVRGLAALGNSTRQALAALEARTPDAPGTVLYADALLEVLLDREPLLSRQLAERYLGPLSASPELVATLRAYLAQDLALTPTAVALNVHKNTVVYRLRRIEELTGLDLHRPRDIARVVVALDTRPADPR